MREDVEIGARPEGSNRVIRGGSWNDYAANCRSATRTFAYPGGQDYRDDGFRLVLPAGR